MQKDYYKILGVIDTAEDAVIKAAYKALMQIYHPDRCSNETDRATSTEKSQEINEAYRVLSNQQLRKDYDSQRTTQKNTFKEDSNNYSDEYTQKNKVLEDSWNIAKQFVDNLEHLHEFLSKLSPDLGFTFKLSILENKLFNNADQVASHLEERYLTKYFGDNKEIKAFGKLLLINNRRDIALELNKTINILGSTFNERKIIDKLINKYKLDLPTKKNDDFNERTNSKNYYDVNAERLANNLLHWTILALIVLSSIFWASKLIIGHLD